MRTWASLMVLIGLALMCFNDQLSLHVLASPNDKESIERMAEMISGKFTNKEQVESTMVDGQPTRDYGEIEWIPLEMKEFEKKPCFYFEHRFYGKLIRSHIIVLEAVESEMIDMKTYNITKSILNRDPSTLEDLTMDDLEYVEGCDPSYYKTGTVNVEFLGEWPECMLYTPEIQMTHPSKFSCETIVFLRFMGPSAPINTHVPYEFRAVKKNPLPPSFCEGKKCKKFCKKGPLNSRKFNSPWRRH